jgi:predicted glycosyltransferase
MRRILFISGSLGLGHVMRDLAIADELRRLDREIEVSWLAAHPASLVLREAKETILPEAERYANDNLIAESASQGFHLNLLKYLSKAREAWATNVRIFAKIIDKEKYDVVIGDETYELALAQLKKPKLNKSPFVMIYDFVGVDSLTANPVDRLMAYMWNRLWAKDYRTYSTGRNIALFVGEPEDVPDRPFGFLLPNRRLHAKAHYRFVGYILSFDPDEYVDRSRVRAKLGYGNEPLIICSVGGTSVGKGLLELCGRSYQLIKAQIPNMRMVLVSGPRISSGSLRLPPEVEVKEYLPDLYEPFAACDLAIVLGGGTSTLELTALRRPFMYFPLEGHFEQEVAVAARLARHRAGEKTLFSRTTPEVLAERVVAGIGRKVDYATVNTGGARLSAQMIHRLL